MLKITYREIINFYIFIVITIFTSTTSQAELFNRGNGMVYDSDQNITWIQDANYAKSSGAVTYHDGRMGFIFAELWVDNLFYEGFFDWRLPTSTQPDLTCSKQYNGISSETGCINSEMGYLYNIYKITSEDEGIFKNVGQTDYFSGTTTHNGERSITFNFFSGRQVEHSINTPFRVWPVRDGDVTVLPEYAADINDVTINISGYLSNDETVKRKNGSERKATIGVICYNYTTGETVRNSNVPAPHGKSTTISCVNDIGISEPSPGDEFRIVVVGYPSHKLLTSTPLQLPAFVTGLSDIEVSDCRNNLTDDRRYLKGSASDVMDCRGIDIGFGHIDLKIYSDINHQVAVGFNGTVADIKNSVICPCFSQNRLSKLPGFSKVNNSPACIDNTDKYFNSGDINAKFPSTSYLFTHSGQNHDGSPDNSCEMHSDIDGILTDHRENLTHLQLLECRQIIRESCYPTVTFPDQ